jgi:hypothetical protein
MVFGTLTTCAEHEGELAEHGPRSRSSWPIAAEGLIDAIVGLWQAPVHRARPRYRTDLSSPWEKEPGAHFAAAVDKSRLSIPHASKELTCKYLTDLKLIGALEQ